MKKWILTILGALLLAGCAEDQTVAPIPSVDDPNQVIEKEDKIKTEDAVTEPKLEGTQEPTDNMETDAVTSQEPVEKTHSVTQTLNLVNYEEYQTLSDKIDLTMYQAELETDNPGKRILLFADATGKKVYKSIFIKHDRYLKIIQLDGEGLLYNHKVQ